MVESTVRDGDVEKALRVLKKKMQREGIFREIKEADCFIKPSQKKREKAQDALRRMRKYLRKLLNYE